jgi:hypothetical protein
MRWQLDTLFTKMMLVQGQQGYTVRLLHAVRYRCCLQHVDSSESVQLYVYGLLAEKSVLRQALHDRPLVQPLHYIQMKPMTYTITLSKAKF